MAKRKIIVKITPNAKTESVSEETPGYFRVRVKSPAKEGKANERLIEILSEYLNIPKSFLNIKLGAKAKQKIVEIENS